MLDEADRPNSTCIRCNTCDGFPCLVHAKSDAEAIGVRPAARACANVTLLVNAEVVKLETRPPGRAVTGSWWSARRQASGGVRRPTSWWSAAGAANSARMLLRSANDRHPAGLANGSDQVGRNYMFHNSRAVAGAGQEANDTVFQKTLGLNDFYFAGDGREWPLGNIQMIGKSNGPR